MLGQEIRTHMFTVILQLGRTAAVQQTPVSRNRTHGVYIYCCHRIQQIERVQFPSLSESPEWNGK